MFSGKDTLVTLLDFCISVIFEKFLPNSFVKTD